MMLTESTISRSEACHLPETNSNRKENSVMALGKWFTSQGHRSSFSKENDGYLPNKVD